MKKPMIILLVLLILSLALPVTASAAATKTVSLLEQEVSVPDDWEILDDGVFAYPKGAGANGDFSDVTGWISLEKTSLSEEELAAIEPDQSSADFDVAVKQAGFENIENAMGHMNTQVKGWAITGTISKNSLNYLEVQFLSAKNAVVKLTIITPADGSLDVSWFTGVAEKVNSQLIFVFENEIITRAAMIAMEGKYEGEFDTDGKRSGFGTWAYVNQLYAGNWANDLPNGEGTLYTRTNGTTQTYNSILHGHWLDGGAEGEMIQTTYSNEGDISVDRIPKAHNGVADGKQLITSLNSRNAVDIRDGDFVGAVPTFTGIDGNHLAEPDVPTPWDLYEKYPDGKVPYEPAIVITNGRESLDLESGNYSNHRYYSAWMAELNDWVFFSAQEGLDHRIYRLRKDGTEAVKLFDRRGVWVDLKNIGDSIYVGGEHKIGPDGIIARLPETGLNQFNRVLGDWIYDIGYLYDTTGYLYGHTLRKTSLDLTERIELATLNFDEGLMEYKTSHTAEFILYVDEEWVYVYNTSNHFAAPPNKRMSQIIRVKNDGSGETQSYLFQMHTEGVTHEGVGLPIFVNGRMYFKEVKQEKSWIETRLQSIDMDFLEEPVTLIPYNPDWHMSDFNVTEDAIYYNVITQEGAGSIWRSDLDGGNPVMLADGFDTTVHKMGDGIVSTGGMGGIFVADDWMAFIGSHKKNSYSSDYPWYVMRTDGSNLHKLGEDYALADTMGLVDSTGKWRYELLEDGTAMIIGAGNKLKLSGKLSIPAKVDKVPVTVIGDSAFAHYDAFTGVTIPKGITTIGDRAFGWCSGLTSVTIPEGVTHIGNGAFSMCEKLKKLALPASLLSVGNAPEPFTNCDALKLSISKKNEVFAIVDGVLTEK